MTYKAERNPMYNDVNKASQASRTRSSCSCKSKSSKGSSYPRVSSDSQLDKLLFPEAEDDEDKSKNTRVSSETDLNMLLCATDNESPSDPCSSLPAKRAGRSRHTSLSTGNTGEQLLARVTRPSRRETLKRNNSQPVLLRTGTKKSGPEKNDMSVERRSRSKDRRGRDPYNKGHEGRQSSSKSLDRKTSKARRSKSSERELDPTTNARWERRSRSKSNERDDAGLERRSRSKSNERDDARLERRSRSKSNERDDAGLERRSRSKSIHRSKSMRRSKSVDGLEEDPKKSNRQSVSKTMERSKSNNKLESSNKERRQRSRSSDNCEHDILNRRSRRKSVDGIQVAPPDNNHRDEMRDAVTRLVIRQSSMPFISQQSFKAVKSNSTSETNPETDDEQEIKYKPTNRHTSSSLSPTRPTRSSRALRRGSLGTHEHGGNQQPRASEESKNNNKSLSYSDRVCLQKVPNSRRQSLAGLSSARDPGAVASKARKTTQKRSRSGGDLQRLAAACEQQTQPPTTSLGRCSSDVIRYQNEWADESTSSSDFDEFIDLGSPELPRQTARGHHQRLKGNDKVHQLFCGQLEKQTSRRELKSQQQVAAPWQNRIDKCH